MAVLLLLITLTLMAVIWWHIGNWQERAIADVESVHQIILAQHPGAVDPENPAFRDMMDQARLEALELAENADSAATHHAALRHYVDIFNDGHLRFAFPDELISGLFSGNESPSGKTITIEPSIVETDNAYWIKIPTFFTLDSTEEITKEVEALGSDLRNADLVVFDLRGNGGGNSVFGDRMAQAIWTQEVFDDWVPASATGVDWRATPENAAHLRRLIKYFGGSLEPEDLANLTETANKIEAAAKNGLDYYREELPTHPTRQLVPSPVKANVVVITDGTCASACLDFMDTITALPGGTHIGGETSSDTQYIEVRFDTTASNTGILIFPIKVYRGRLRPANGTFVPEIEIDPTNLDLQAVRELLANHQELLSEKVVEQN